MSRDYWACVNIDEVLSEQLRGNEITYPCSCFSSSVSSSCRHVANSIAVVPIDMKVGVWTSFG